MAVLDSRIGHETHTMAVLDSRLGDETHTMAVTVLSYFCVGHM